MALIYQAILIGAALVSVSIIAGMFSSRIGAPLLLVFLGLGMLAGVDGLGGIEFDDFRATYLVGSVALALILFDGGLRTPREAFRLAMWPALSLATAGVLVTALVAGLAAMYFLDFSLLEGLLVGATVASTDAAAVFLLLHTRGTELKRRVSATLEIESGVNDPMAIFLTVTCVELLLTPHMAFTGHFAMSFLIQMVGGAAIGFLGGMFLVFLINRIEIAAGLYPILAAAMALVIFASAQIIDASGFLAVYLAGLVMGNQRHRAQQVISRFHDGLAWLAQITMFLLLGLLATPSQMVSKLGGELAIAIILIVVARPIAVWLSLLPFRFTWQEKAFISWVGLRGAVPIFLASIPVIAGVSRGIEYFNVAFVVVIASLIVQGWTVSRAAQFFGLELPPPPEPIERREIDLPPSADREAASVARRQQQPGPRPALSRPQPAATHAHHRRDPRRHRDEPRDARAAAGRGLRHSAGAARACHHARQAVLDAAGAPLRPGPRSTSASSASRRRCRSDACARSTACPSSRSTARRRWRSSCAIASATRSWSATASRSVGSSWSCARCPRARSPGSGSRSSRRPSACRSCACGAA